MQPLIIRSLFFTGLSILGTGVVGFIFWSIESLRAATPLVFISGAAVLAILAARIVVRALPRIPTLLTTKKTIQNLWKEGIPELITKLYFHHMRHYPEWIRVSRDFVPSSITLAGKTDEGWVRMLLYYADYVFIQTEAPLSTSEARITLQIVRENIPVITLVIRRTSQPGEKDFWEPLQIIDVTPGSWIRELQNLKAEIVAIIKDRERDAREN